MYTHPELGFEEHRTPEFVAGTLAEFGCEVHRKIGETGVVGVSDWQWPVYRWDALPMREANDFPYRSPAHRKIGRKP